MLTTDEARKKECRLVPMVMVPGNMAGTVNIVAPQCSADTCMHWAGTPDSELAGTKGVGRCAMEPSPYGALVGDYPEEKTFE